jgi:predicted RNA binding protein YcfA (HicA-like mRNA interferase family)
LKLPRDIPGTELARLLHRVGYSVTRQVGSHMRLSTNVNGEHHVTVPAHHNLRPGTLEFVLTVVARHLGIDRHRLETELLAAAE